MIIVMKACQLKAHLQVVSKLKTRPELQAVFFDGNNVWSGDGQVMMKSGIHQDVSPSQLIRFDSFTMPRNAQTAVINTDLGLVYLLKDYYVSAEYLPCDPEKLHLYAVRIAKASPSALPYPGVGNLKHARGSVSGIEVITDNLEKIHKVARSLSPAKKAVEISFQNAKESTFLAKIKQGVTVCEMFIKVAK